MKLQARKHPSLLKCTVCNSTATPKDQYAHAMAAASLAAGLPPDVPATNEEVASLKWRGVPLGNDAASALRRCIVLTHSQSHKPSHHPTCLKSLKAKKSGLCRGKLPASNCPACAVEFVLGCPDHPDVELQEQPEEQTSERKAFISALIQHLSHTQDPAALRCALQHQLSGAPVASAAGPEGVSSSPAAAAFDFCPHVHMSLVLDIVKEVLAFPDDTATSWIILLNRMLEINSAPRSQMCVECGNPHEVISLSLALRRDAVSTWISQYSPTIGACFGCNNNCQYVKNPLVSLYAGMYGTKSTRENAESLDQAVGGVFRTLARMEHESSPAPAAENDAADFRKGLRMLNAGWRGLTGAEVVGSPRAGLLTLSADYAWVKSHENVDFAPSMCRDILLKKPIRWQADARGTRVPKAFDYINRPPEFLEHDPLYLFENYERVTLKSLERNRTQPSESPAAAAAGSEGQLHLSGFDLEAPATEPDAHTRRPRYYFASEHPLHETHALQKTKT